jgi:hypothetical protein
MEESLNHCEASAIVPSICEEEDTCMSYEEEDTRMSYEEEGTRMSYEEEDKLSHEEEDTCKRARPSCPTSVRNALECKDELIRWFMTR